MREYLGRQMGRTIDEFVHDFQIFPDHVPEAKTILVDILADTFTDLSIAYGVSDNKLAICVRPPKLMQGEATGQVTPDRPMRGHCEVDLVDFMVVSAFTDILHCLVIPASRYKPDALSTLLFIAAHEMYHVRQFFQDRKYFTETANGTDLSVRKGNLGERSADAVTTRYFKEKTRALHKAQGNSRRDVIALRANKMVFAGMIVELREFKDVPYERRQAGR